jgi:hypothetical protein
MKVLATTDAYTIAVDPAKNRIHFTMRGTWTKRDDFRNWLNDVKAAVDACSPGFTELIDWRESTGILMTNEIEEAQKMAVKGGLRKAARLYDRQTFLKTQMDQLTEKTGFPVKSFFDQAEAEDWLDQG